MADNVDQVHMNDAMLSANTFSVKEEQYQGDSIEDKMYISETGLTVDNAELQRSIRYPQIKQYEESTSTDNIKIELASFEETKIQNDDVKRERGISPDIKIEFDNGLLYCEHCDAYFVDYCNECGMLVHILNRNVLHSADSGARADIPTDILEIQDCFGQTGVYALRIIPAGVKFGPFTGLSGTECPWEMKGDKFVLDKNKWKYLNWMQYVNPTKNTCNGNLHVFQSEDNIYYQSTCQIQPGDELLVYFGEEFGNSSNKIVMDFATTKKNISEDVFACTFCYLGFSSKSHLAKHKILCVEDTAGKFSIEELTQCSFCKIYLERQEYFEHHMAFCCERNARKSFLPTPLAMEATTALNRHKRCLRKMYKCEQCKYRTKYQADLKEHTKQHYEVKIYKCGICNRRFKTKEIHRLHMENTHADVGGKDDQKDSTTDYMNTHIKVQQSSSRDQKKIFKCSLCLYRVKYKHCLRRHMKTKHLKEFGYQCDSCEYRTNTKHDLKRHIKTKHLKEFDNKCDSCEYRTNNKNNLKRHIKTKHLKEFDYKCDSCEFRTNSKNHLEVHIKTIHLKKLNNTCDSCEYRTNNESDLKRHIKTTHLKEFDNKCDSCEYKTNNNSNLKRHIKTKHLKKFDHKCNSCDYRTNNKKYLEAHIKTIHLKELNNKCDSCEYRTNNESDLKRHIKTKHLKEFDYKCDSCEYRANNKNHLEVHIKTNHLKEFDYKCDSCEYRTNNKIHLEVHIKTIHLKEFDYKCDSCEYRTNIKDYLEKHIKTKHLKKFNYKCDSCEFRTNYKASLKTHIKTNHLKGF